MKEPFKSIAEANSELRSLVLGSGLSFDCGCGGKLGSTIAIVAEAPGEREVQQNMPLIGGSGNYLWDILRKDKLGRNDVYITNVIKRKLVSSADAHQLQPKKEKITIPKQERVDMAAHTAPGTEQTTEPEIRCCTRELRTGSPWLVSLVSPTNGGVCSPWTSVERRVQVLCTFNPAHVMREPRMEVVFRMDLNKLQKLMKGTFSVPTYRLPHQSHLSAKRSISLRWLQHSLTTDCL